ncbi:MAG: 5'-nucleotidase C-terminal domain-containing protein [Flavobacteriales bacterium]|jgi:5'-nucleotidase|nr:5'-nucleotidase C-terminal domain-containing protein [Flavobacteriales bacterium]
MKQTILTVLIIGFSLSSCKEAQKTNNQKESANNYQYAQENTPVENKQIDTTLDRQLTFYRKDMQKRMSSVLTQTNKGMVKKRPQSAMTNLMADMVHFESEHIFKQEVDFCLVNYGGIRNSLPKGDITLGNVYELMPFDNTVVLLRLNGDSIIPMVKYLKKRNGEPISGMELKFTKDGTSHISINGEEFDSHKEYWVATSDYLANGGDRMSFLSNPIERKNSEIKIRDLIIDYFKKNPKIIANEEERIIYEN